MERPKTPEDEAELLRKQKMALEARHELVTTAEQLANPEAIQKVREERQSELVRAAEEARKEAREVAERERQRLEEEKKMAEQAAAEEHAKREAAEKEAQARYNQALMDKLTELEKSRKPLQDQFNEYFSFVELLSEKFGLQKPGTTAPVVTQDPRIALEIEKLRLEDARAQREFELKMAQDKKEWDLKLLELQRQAEWKEREFQLQEKKDKQLFSIPEVIGGAIAKGIVDRAEAIQQPTGYHIEAPTGVAGDIECPKCRSRIGVGPTQTLAQCIGCNTKYSVVRTPPATAPPQPTPQPTGPTEGEE